MKSSFTMAIVLILLLPVTTGARTWLIKDDGTGDAATIQAGIDSAAAADTVLLADGTYTGSGNRDINFNNKAITVRSQSGQCHLCWIDCEGTAGDPHVAFTFNHGETSSSVLEGISITGAYGSSSGAVGVFGSSPTINSCCFTGNTAGIAGGALDMTSSAAQINNCLFLSNEGLSAGGAIYMETSSPTISGCSFDSNTSPGNGGAVYCHTNSPTIEECVFSHNEGMIGGAVYLDNCDASLSYCEFWRNSSAMEGGALKCNLASATLENCTFAADSSGTGGAVVVITAGGTPGFTNTLIAFSRRGPAIACEGEVGAGFACCNFYGNEGGDWVPCIAVHAGINGNMSTDPLFCDLSSRDLNVESCSPCLAGNNTCGVNVGRWGQGCGCGEAVEPTTWGAVKAMYR
jgi:predicted outer membrane repeat protein